MTQMLPRLWEGCIGKADSAVDMSTAETLAKKKCMRHGAVGNEQRGHSVAKGTRKSLESND